MRWHVEGSICGYVDGLELEAGIIRFSSLDCALMDVHVDPTKVTKGVQSNFESYN